MPGKPSRDKGARREREVVARFREWGLRAQRVPLSGATAFARHDVLVESQSASAGFKMLLEVKGRKSMPGWLKAWLSDADMLVLVPDRDDWLYVLPEKTLKRLMQNGKD